MPLGACLNTGEAYRARNIMKNCAKPCLQTCWANPQADSLTNIIDTFIYDLKKDNIDRKSKKESLFAALSKLTDYEELLKECST